MGAHHPSPGGCAERAPKLVYYGRQGRGSGPDDGNFPAFDDLTADFSYARLRRCAEDEPAGYAPDDLDDLQFVELHNTTDKAVDLSGGRPLALDVWLDPGPGQAVLYGTNRLFLERLGLDSLDDLPPLAEFVPGPEVMEALEQGLRADAE